MSLKNVGIAVAKFFQHRVRHPSGCHPPLLRQVACVRRASGGQFLVRREKQPHESGMGWDGYVVRKILTLGLALAFSLLMGGSALADGGNVGVAHHLTLSPTYDVAGNLVPYTCSYVHRTAVAGGFQDRETCTLGAGAVLPTKAVTRTYGPGTWASDYVIATTGGYAIATSVKMQFTPSGQVIITSFYAAP